MDDEFELTVIDGGDATRATVIARSGYDSAIALLLGIQLQPFVDFHALLSATAAGRAPNKPTPDQLTKFGRDLFDLVVQDDIRTIYDRLPQSHIRLKIYSHRPDLQTMPWEYIQEPRSVPGPNLYRSVVRIVPTIGVPAPAPKKLDDTVRMLFVYAEPLRLLSIDWPTIKATVESQFRARLPTNFELDVVEGATTDSFTSAFQRKKYDILHMVCHGEVAPDGTGSLLFQDIKGKSKEPIPADKLAGFLKDKDLRLVVLSACNTSAGDFAKEFKVIANALVASGVPAVVANQFEIQTTAAATFAGAFYAELLQSGDLDLATTKGRVLLDFGAALPNNVARIDWGIPTLYRHLGAAKAFKP